MIAFPEILLNNMTYEEYISDLKDEASKRVKLKTTDPNYVCYHSHHIVPKSLGGINLNDNLILLTCAEHIKAHILLCEKYKDNESIYFKMLCALLRLVSGFNSLEELELNEIDIEKQGKLLEERAILNSKFSKGKKKNKYTSPYEGLSENEAKELHKKWSMRLKGIKRSNDYKKHMSISQKNNPNNPMVKAAAEGKNFFAGKKHTEKSKLKMSISKRGKSIYYGLSEEEAKKRYEQRCVRNKGANNPCYGKKRYVFVKTGQVKLFKTHPGEGYVTTAEWAKMKNIED